MELLVNDQLIMARVESTEELESPHTGRSLQKIGVRFSVRGDLSFLSDGDTTIDSSDGRRFKPDRTYSYSESGGISSFVGTLTEFEDPPKAAAVVLNESLRLEPELYKEEGLAPGMVIIDLVTTLAGSHHEALEELIKAKARAQYFPVSREGVRDGTIEMRFGRCLWERLDDGRVKHLVVLVQKSYDDAGLASAHGLGEPEMSNAMIAIATLQTLVDELLNELITGGLMTTEGANRIKSVSGNEDRWNRRQFNRTRELETWFKD